MSEQILEAIIQLFALLARIDGLKPSEREKMLSLADRILGDKKEKNDLIKLFDLYSGHTESTFPEYQFDGEEDILNKIVQICHKLRRETVLQQRFALTSQLMQLIIADEHLSEIENKTIDLVGRELNIPPDILKEIKNFLLAKELKDFDSEHVVIIKENDNDRPLNCKFIKASKLDGFIALLHLKKSKPFFFRYLGDSYLLHNATPVPKDRILLFPPGSNFRSDEMDPIHYSDVIGQFKNIDENNKISFVAEDITLKFKKGNYGLRNVDVDESEGKLVGIMGASGSGKSTLINVLNGNEIPTGGRVIINGIDIHKNQEAIEGVIGYVPQDDLLIEDLTVFQNLFYSAKLCFKGKTDDQITDLVNKTLHNLGIYETKDLRVGNPLNKTISGGQRKRLNIGLELLREPLIMFVDEPTSGLSSRDSENIMDLLKELTLSGKLIFVVIHQPSSDIFKMFDKLLVLDIGGYPIYYGDPIESINYFRDALKIIDKSESICLHCGNVNTEQVFNIIELKVVDGYGNPTSERRFSPEYWNRFYLEKNVIQKSSSVPIKPKPSLNIPGKINQAYIFIKRDFLSKISNKQYVIINLFEAPFLAFVLSMFIRFYPGDGFTPSAYVFYDNVNIPVYLFMAIIVGLFMGLTVSAEEIIKDRRILKREKFLHLSQSSYIFSKLIILFTLSAIQAASFVLIGNLVMGIKGMFLAYWAVVFSISCFANVLGLNISSAFNSVVTIYILIPILLIPQLILSGVMVKYDELNPSFTDKTRVPAVGELMAAKWGYEALVVKQFRDNEYEKLFYDQDRVMSNADFKNVYYIPKLLSKLDYAMVNLNKDDAQVKERMAHDLAIVKHEFVEELKFVGIDKFKYIDKLNLDNFDSLVYSESKLFLNNLKKMYLNQYQTASKEKEATINNQSDTPEKRQDFEELKKLHTNEQINNIALNNKITNRIIEEDGELVQKIYPIYMSPDPSHLFDFTSQMFQPTKYFAGFVVDTFYFDITVIWMMTFLLVVALYYELLRRVINPKEFAGVAKNKSDK